MRDLKRTEALELMPRASVMIEAMRDIGYSFDSAVADIIDNSIAAGAKNIDLRYGWEADLPWIGVIDDGCGMSRDDLLEAMRPGSKDPRLEREKNDLGRFGLGLKTASFSQCRELTVVTNQAASTHAMQWDLDHVADTDRWEIKEIHDSELADLPCGALTTHEGTVVVWRKIDRLELAGLGEMGNEAFNELMSSVRQHLARIFHRFLSGELGLKKWAAAGSVDTNLSFLSFLELYRTDVAQRRMTAPGVVEALDVIEHICPGLLSAAVDLPGNAFRLH
jgi:hypothetical protein